MDIEIDMSGVDMGVVNEVIVAMADALMDADHIDPSLEETLVAIGELLRMMLEDGEVLPPIH